MDDDKLQSLRLPGMLLAGAALVAVVLMHHHPHGGDGAGLIRSVHGALSAMIVIQAAVMILVARALGWSFHVALGLAFFVLGICGALVAGSINGFVVPALLDYPASDIGSGTFELAWELNQQFARNGAVAVGTGIAFFGLSLWRAGWRLTGAVGLIAGLVPAALLIAGAIDMRFYGAMFTYISQLSWLILLGLMLARGARRTG
ncbi:hypothetical protein P7228_13260 [Altererythrobacter arenosus]|uniref:DUF4386 family protein n=1 Tax=Altererythrobacter arenosus TaxID=3032592 RepID=A0ABY8FPL8_9SPHN|nr:hypothetical protein [Altererythrobacter sp. CAU 1644]WFL76948.1 hypothetical protein P7228_13260 [Altererythrobacter sp. CAU 1644]